MAIADTSTTQLQERLTNAEERPDLSSAAISSAAVVSLDFDDGRVPNFGLIGDAYLDRGVWFDGAMAFDFAFNTYYYPPYSGTGVIGADLGGTSGRFTMHLDQPASEVLFYATTLEPLVVTCRNAAGAIVARREAVYPNLAHYDRSVAGANQQMKLSGSGIVSCVFAGTANLYAVDGFRLTPERGADVVLACVGADGQTAILRGEDVICTATVSPDQPYKLVRWSAVGDGQETTLDYDEEVAAGEPSIWRGPTVLDTEVTVTIAIDTGAAAREVQAEASYTAAARRSSEWLMRINRRPRPVVVGTYVHVKYEPQGAGDLAFMDLWPSPPDGGRVILATVGPNVSWSYIETPFAATDPVAFMNKALYPGDPWYVAQTGGRVQGTQYQGSLAFYCTAVRIDQLRTDVLKHEGVNVPWPQSHYDVFVAELPSLDLSQMIEGIVSFGDMAAPARAVNDSLRVWKSRIDQKNKPVDQNDASRVKLPCTFKPTSP